MGCGGNCGSCGGDCGSCGGCAGQLVLTEAELALLDQLGQYAFLPVARKDADMTPVYLEDTQFSREAYTLALQLLEKKQLIEISYDRPLGGMDMTAYQGFPVHGSIGLTQRGQSVLDTLNLNGIIR